MYQEKSIPFFVKQNIPFQSKLMRQLGESQFSAIFIILIECLLATNNQRKIDAFHQNEIYQNTSFAQYQQFLKKTFNIKDQITFQRFLELQKGQDPDNVQAGEFLKVFYWEKTRKYITVPCIIEFLHENFDVKIFNDSSSQIYSVKSLIPKDSSALLFLEKDSYYSIINQQQSSLQKFCQLCYSTSANFIQDKGKHVYCLDCLQKEIIQKDKFYYTCKICMENISKLQVINFEKELQLQGKFCSKCHFQFVGEQYYQNSCIHNLCQKCVKDQIRIKTCIIDNCSTKVDHDTLRQFYNSCGSQLQENEQSSDKKISSQANQANFAQNIYQNRQLVQSQNSQQIQPQINQPINEEYHNCADCQRQYKLDMLFKNYCGHFYCGECSNRYSGNIYRIYCKGFRCSQQIDFKQLKQFFIDPQTKQYKKKQDNCTICGFDLPFDLMFQNQCKHNICFDCIYRASKNQQNWLSNKTCPNTQCRLDINMKELEDFFLIKQYERQQEIQL